MSTMASFEPPFSALADWYTYWSGLAESGRVFRVENFFNVYKSASRRRTPRWQTKRKKDHIERRTDVSVVARVRDVELQHVVAEKQERETDEDDVDVTKR